MKKQTVRVKLVVVMIVLGKEDKRMEEPKRVAAKEVYERLRTGTTLLVCAYEDDAKFRKMKLQGAISLKEFESKLATLSKDHEIVFYCG